MALTDTAIRNAKPRDRDYKLADGNGLYLLVTPSGGKLWRLKYRLDGIERKLALGKYPAVSLLDARKARAKAMEDAGKGEDPAAAKRPEWLKLLADQALCKEKKRLIKAAFMFLSPGYQCLWPWCPCWWS